MSFHSKLTGNSAIHPIFYRGSSDPASPDVSVTGPNKTWVDDTTGTNLANGWIWKIRNAGNTAWDTLLDLAAALALKANLASPAFTGNPTAPTPSLGDNDTSIATTAFVTAAIGSGAPPIGTAGGDLTGTYPNPTLAVSLTTLTDGATVTWTVTNKREDMAQLTIAGARTLAISGATAGFRGALHITESGTGRSLALPSGSIVANSGAGAIALSGASGGKQKWTVSYDGTNYWWEKGATYT